MADSNMTIGAVTGATIKGRRTRLNKVTFTQTAAGAAGNATTTFPVTGTLLRFITTGGDAAWTFTINDGTAVIFTSASLTATATSGALNMHATIPHKGIPLVGQTMLVTIAGSATNPVTITLIWEDSDTEL